MLDVLAGVALLAAIVIIIGLDIARRRWRDAAERSRRLLDQAHIKTGAARQFRLN